MVEGGREQVADALKNLANQVEIFLFITHEFITHELDAQRNLFQRGFGGHQP